MPEHTTEVCYSCERPLGFGADEYKGHKLCASCYRALAQKKALELVDMETQQRLDQMGLEIIGAKAQIDRMEKEHGEEIARLTDQIVERDEYIALLLEDDTNVATEKWKQFFNDAEND